MSKRWSGFFEQLCSITKLILLSWTMHPKIERADKPEDYDEILHHVSDEVKFHTGSLFSILFFLATLDEAHLISWTVACLLFALFVLTVLAGISGNVLHTWIDEVPFGRVLLALFVKLPAMSVLGIVIGLANNRWDGPFTRGVFYILMAISFAILAVWLIKQEEKIRAGISQCYLRTELLRQQSLSVPGRIYRHMSDRRREVFQNSEHTADRVEENPVNAV